MYIQAYPSASPSGPTWRMDGGGTTYPESLPPPVGPLSLLKYFYLT